MVATTCPFPISGISPSESGEFCFRFRVLLFYATQEGLTDKEVMALLAVETVEITLPGGRKKQVSVRLSRNTYYKYKAELKGEGLLAM